MHVYDPNNIGTLTVYVAVAIIAITVLPAFTNASITSVTLSPAKVTINSGSPVTFTVSWSGGTSPYDVSLFSSSTPACNAYSTFVQQETAVSANSADFSPVTPSANTYYCAYVTDNSPEIYSISNIISSNSITQGFYYPVSTSFSPSGKYAYVTNPTGEDIVIINTTTNSIISTILKDTDPQEVAISPNGAYAYVTNLNDNNVSVINTTTNTVSELLNSGFSSPTGVAFSPSGTYAYVANLGSNNVVVINTATGTITSSITSGLSGPEGISFSPSGTFAYITNSASNNVVIVNTNSNTITGSIISGFSQPESVAIAPVGTYAYVSNPYAHNVVIINTITNSVLGAEALNTYDPMGLAFSSSGTYMYILNYSLYSGKVLVVNPGEEVANSTSSNIMINTPLQAPIITPSNPTIDFGQAITLTASLVGGNVPYNAIWYTGPSGNTCAQDSSNTLAAYYGLSTASNSLQVSPATSNSYCIIVTDSSNTPVTQLSQNDVVLVSSALTSPSIAASNTPSVNTTQYELFSTSWSGGTSVYTANYLVFNTITHTVMANALYTGITVTSNAFLWKVPPVAYGNTISANVLITDSAYFSEKANSVNVTTITVSGTPPTSTTTSTTSISSTSSTMSTTTTVSSGGGSSGGGGGSGGGGSFKPSVVPYNTSNVHGWKILNFSQDNTENVEINGKMFDITLNSISPTLVDISVNGYSYTLTVNQPVLLTGSSNYSLDLNSISYLPIVDTAAVYIYANGSVQTHITPVIITANKSNPTIGINVTYLKPEVFNLAADNVVIGIKYLNSKSSNTIKGKISVLNVTANMSLPANYVKIKLLNITENTTPVNQSLSLNLSIKYNCSIPSSRQAAFIYENGVWVKITPLSINSATCTAEFDIPADPIVGLFEAKAISNTTSSTIITTSVPVTAVNNHANSTKTAGASHYSGGITAVVVASIITVVAIVFYEYRRIKRGKIPPTVLPGSTATADSKINGTPSSTNTSSGLGDTNRTEDSRDELGYKRITGADLYFITAIIILFAAATIISIFNSHINILGQTTPPVKLTEVNILTGIYSFPSAPTNLILVNQGWNNSNGFYLFQGNYVQNVYSLTNYQTIQWSAATNGTYPIAYYEIYRNGVAYATVNAPTKFQGYINGDILTVTNMISGTIVEGADYNASGVAAQTIINITNNGHQINGTPGGIGSYYVNIPQTAGSANSPVTFTAWQFIDSNATNSDNRFFNSTVTAYSYAVAAVDSHNQSGPMDTNYTSYGYYNGYSDWGYANYNYGGGAFNFFSTSGDPLAVNAPYVIQANTIGHGGGLLIVANPPRSPDLTFGIGAFKYAIIEVNPGPSINYTLGVDQFVRLPPGDLYGWMTYNDSNAFIYGPIGYPKVNTWETLKIPLTTLGIGQCTFTGSISGNVLTVTSIDSGPAIVEEGGFIYGPGIPAGAYTAGNNQSNAIGTFTIAGPGINASTHVPSEIMGYQKTAFYKTGIWVSSPGGYIYYVSKIGWTTN